MVPKTFFVKGLASEVIRSLIWLRRNKTDEDQFQGLKHGGLYMLNMVLGFKNIVGNIQISSF